MKIFGNFFFILVSVLLLPFVAKAQSNCNDVVVSVKAGASTCQSNGTLTVTLTGSSVTNLRLDDAEYQVESVIAGGYVSEWTQSSTRILTGVPPGTYNVNVRTFCLQDSQWTVITSTATAVVTSSYQVPEIYITSANIRPSLNCIASGMIPISITKGSAPYTIVMTSYPSGYTGTKSFTATAAGNFEVDDLAPGSYKFKVTDACSYATEELSATVGAVSADFTSGMLYSVLAGTSTPSTNCSQVRIRQGFNISGTRPEVFYFVYTKSSKYYEWAFLMSNNLGGTKSWVSFEDANMYMDYTMAVTIKYFRDNNLYIQPYVRIKGSSCEYTLNPIRISAPIPAVDYSDFGCATFTVKHKPNTNSDYRNNDVFCYPYQWQIVDASNNVLTSWSSNIYDYTEQTATNVPYGAKINFRDSEGYTWTQTLLTTEPSYTLTYNNTWGMDGADESGYFKNSWRMYMTVTGTSGSVAFPAGTKIRYISGPTVPQNTEFTLTEQVVSIYPFNASPTVSESVAVRGGLYQFEITFPGCSPVTKSFSVSSYRIVQNLSYTLGAEGCEGQYIIPNGQVASVNSSGETNVATYFKIESVNPSSISFDRTAVAKGGSLLLPATGKYTIAILHSSSGTWGAEKVVVDYTKKNVALNNAVTSAYVCVGESVGHIRVEGQYGSNNYEYTLLDNGTVIETNNTGYFNYGSIGNTYTIRINDITCNSSFEQNVIMADLTSTKIVSSSSPVYCKGEDIQLYCATLGITEYSWTGPGGWTSTAQNPLVPGIATAGTYTFTVTVTPEKCGQPVIRSINIVVSDPPFPNVSNREINYCLNQASASLLVASGAAVTDESYKLKWYSADGITAITPPSLLSTSRAGSVVYYVSQATNYCEGEKVKIVVNTSRLCATISPSDQNVCVGKAQPMACSVDLPDGAYQWQSSLNGSEWANIEGATQKTYTIAVQKRGVIYYRVVVTDGGETANSEPVRVKLNSCSLPVNHNISIMEF